MILVVSVTIWLCCFAGTLGFFVFLGWATASDPSYTSAGFREAVREQMKFLDSGHRTTVMITRVSEADVYAYWPLIEVRSVCLSLPSF
jgi:hypothetical protein